MNQDPSISVIMPVYNAELYVKEAIESILSQTYKDFEFIIINDGSTDQSFNIIQDFAKKDNRIKIITRKNQGLIYSLNEGIKKAQGKYIARMDADDISLPERLEKQLEFMEKNTNIGICGTWIEVFGENLIAKKWKLSCSDKRLKAELLFSSCFAHPSVMIRKNLLIENNLSYNKDFLHVEDFKLWVDLAELTELANVDKILLKYRIVETSVTRVADQNSEQRYQVLNKIFQKYLQVLKIDNTKEEDLLHFNLSVNERIRDNNLSFDDLSKYFDKLSLANKKENFFDPFELYKVLGKKWLWNFIYTKKMKAIYSKYFFYGILSIIYK